MTAAARPLLTPNGPRIGTRGQVKGYDALRLTSEQSPGLNDPVSLYRSQRPHVIETFELRGGSNLRCGCMHTWINVRTRIGSNLGYTWEPR